KPQKKFGTITFDRPETCRCLQPGQATSRKSTVAGNSRSFELCFSPRLLWEYHVNWINSGTRVATGAHGELGYVLWGRSSQHRRAQARFVQSILGTSQRSAGLKLSYDIILRFALPNSSHDHELSLEVRPIDGLCLGTKDGEKLFPFFSSNRPTPAAGDLN
ncbi:hypothetical protein C7212DRAFT_332509, partial [Tuber magnatum]